MCPERDERMRIAGLGIVAALSLLTGEAYGSWGERYIAGSLSYSAVSTEMHGYLHAPVLSGGVGYYVTDFSLVEGEIGYGATRADGEFRHIMGFRGVFRMLIDVTEWVPSVGASAGWLSTYATDDGLQGGGFIGFSACVDRRTSRSHSWGVCGEIAAFPLSDHFQAVHTIGIRFNGFLPYLWE